MICGIYDEPRFQYTPSGYLKSRFIDDKAGVAYILSMVKYLKDHQLKPKYRTILAFPHYEEIGHGGAYVPLDRPLARLPRDLRCCGFDYKGRV